MSLTTQSFFIKPSFLLPHNDQFVNKNTLSISKKQPCHFFKTKNPETSKEKIEYSLEHHPSQSLCVKNFRQDL